MSLQARQALLQSRNVLLRNDEQRKDFLADDNVSGLKTDVIAFLTEICVVKKHIIVITAARHDHKPDSCLGLHTHENGFCVDCWPLWSRNPTNYIDADTPNFKMFLADCAQSVWLYQIGLAGTADTVLNERSAGRTVFSDAGADHIHLGCV